MWGTFREQSFHIECCVLGSPFVFVSFCDKFVPSVQHPWLLYACQDAEEQACVGDEEDRSRNVTGHSRPPSGANQWHAGQKEARC